MLRRLVETIIELKPFDLHRLTRIALDSSQHGLGAMLGHYNTHGWQPKTFDSRYLNGTKKKLHEQNGAASHLIGNRTLPQLHIRRFFIG